MTTDNASDTSSGERDRGSVEPRIIAILAAAASEVLGAPVAIHRVTPAHGEAERWSRAGRTDIMRSHWLRSKR